MRAAFLVVLLTACTSGGNNSGMVQALTAAPAQEVTFFATNPMLPANVSGTVMGDPIMVDYPVGWQDEYLLRSDGALHITETGVSALPSNPEALEAVKLVAFIVTDERGEWMPMHEPDGVYRRQHDVLYIVPVWHVASHNNNIPDHLLAATGRITQ